MRYLLACLLCAACQLSTQTEEAPVAKVSAAAAPKVAAYVLTGDLPALQAKGTIRFLVAGEGEYLPRAGDPAAAERALAEAFAAKLNLKADFVSEEPSTLIAALSEGRGDVIAASLAVTPERQAQIGFSRPLRFVKQMVVVKKESPIAKRGDLAGKEIIVRASSSYAQTLHKVAGAKIKAADEKLDTFALIQKVARGEEAITVADSDIVDAALTFEPGIKAAFALTDKDPIAWGVRKDAVALKTALDGFIQENALTSHSGATYKADLDEILRRKVLRVLTRNNSTCFFIYRGEQLGFEFELAREFAKSLGVRLEIVVPPTREALAAYLREGRGDIIAAGMTATAERAKEFAFTAPYNEVSELVVVNAKSPANALADLKGVKVLVRKSSSYYQTLQASQAQYGYTVVPANEDLETEELLDQLAQGKIEATVADSNIVDIESQPGDAQRALGPLGAPQQQAWMLRQDQPQLVKAASAYLKKIYKGVFYNMTVTKYFKNTKQIKAATGLERSDTGGSLSPYDDLVKRFAKEYEFDWRLVTSQMYQESHFDPHAKSWVGALGLMQVMPKTAKDLHFEDVVAPDQGIAAGVKLMARYANIFTGNNVKEKDRIRFALASYNCGPGHIADARRLAKDQGLDPDKWFGNVEKSMLLLSLPQYAKRARYGYCRCSEPVKYVSEIQTRYDAYAKLVTLE